MLSAQAWGGQEWALEHEVFIIFLQVFVQSAAGLGLYFELFLFHQFHVRLCSFERMDVETDGPRSKAVTWEFRASTHFWRHFQAQKLKAGSARDLTVTQTELSLERHVLSFKFSLGCILHAFVFPALRWIQFSSRTPWSDWTYGDTFIYCVFVLPVRQ